MDKTQRTIIVSTDSQNTEIAFGLQNAIINVNDIANVWSPGQFPALDVFYKFSPDLLIALVEPDRATKKCIKKYNTKVIELFHEKINYVDTIAYHIGKVQYKFKSDYMYFGTIEDEEEKRLSDIINDGYNIKIFSNNSNRLPGYNLKSLTVEQLCNAITSSDTCLTLTNKDNQALKIRACEGWYINGMDAEPFIEDLDRNNEPIESESFINLYEKTISSI